MRNRKKDNLKDFLKIKNSTETTADLYFYGDIVSSWWGAWEDSDQYPDKVKSFLDEAKGKDLNISVNSGGGSVFAGMAIYNMLKRHQGHKTVYVDGVAGSISSVIAFAGDKVVIPSNAYLMVHKPWTWAQGNADELREQADILDIIEKGILNVYEDNKKENVDMETIEQLVKDSTWLTGEEASNYFNIEVSNAIEAVACVSDYYQGNIPKDICNYLKTPNKENNEHKINNNLEIEKQNYY